MGRLNQRAAGVCVVSGRGVAGGRQLAALAVCGVLAGWSVEALAQSVNVSAQCNIYGAGHSAVRADCSDPGPGPGILPVSVGLPAGAGSGRAWVEFLGVSGTISFCTGSCGVGPAGPDGVNLGTYSHNPIDGIAGVTLARIRGLMGVFLGDSEPQNPAPASLVFNDVTFAELSPGIGQQFFIGDGLTGTGTGSVQRFNIPAGATRLFLGFTDGLGPCVGWYSDNSGGASATVDVLGLCPCPADFDGSGGTPDATDIDAFFSAWLQGEPAADADCSGGTPDSTDIDAFFGAWLAGGC